MIIKKKNTPIKYLGIFNKIFSKFIYSIGILFFSMFLIISIYYSTSGMKESFPPKEFIKKVDRIIFNKYSLLIVSQELIKVAYRINIIETKKSLNLLNTIPPIFLVISADIKDEIDQQKAARIAKTK